MIGKRGNLWTKLVSEIHNSHIKGHTSVQNTYKRLKTMFYWPPIKTAVKQFVKKCGMCKKKMIEMIAYHRLLQPLPIQEGLWRNITMDFIEWLPSSRGRILSWS